MELFLWIVQVLLAVLFALVALLKTTQPKDKLAPKMPWVDDFSTGTVRFVGIVELLAAIGLVLPAATGIAPILTPIAATGLAITMVLAAGVHIRRREPSAVGLNVILLVLSAFVAWGRFGPYGG